MPKKLVEVKALRNGICTPRISNSVEGKVYVVTAEEAETLSAGDNPSVKVLGDYKPPKAAEKKAAKKAAKKAPAKKD